MLRGYGDLGVPSSVSPGDGSPPPQDGQASLGQFANDGQFANGEAAARGPALGSDLGSLANRIAVASRPVWTPPLVLGHLQRPDAPGEVGALFTARRGDVGFR